MAAGSGRSAGGLPPDGSAFTAVLTTAGRRTGRAHPRPLRAVVHGGVLYFSRHRPDSDWFRNAAANPAVSVRVGGREIAGTAEVVRDPGLLHRVSELKYPGQARAREGRVAIAVRLCGQS